MLQVLVGNFCEVSFLGEVLADETVGVFVDGAFVGGVGVGEVDVHVEALGEVFVPSEFSAVVNGEGVHEVLGQVREGFGGGLV